MIYLQKREEHKKKVIFFPRLAQIASAEVTTFNSDWNLKSNFRGLKKIMTHLYPILKHFWSFNMNWQQIAWVYSFITKLFT